MKHLLIIPSWYSSRHRPIVGVFFKEQAEILSKKIDKVGVISPLFRSFKDLDKSRNMIYFREENGVIVYTKEIWHYPYLTKFNNKNWFITCKYLFEKYTEEHGFPDIIHVHSITQAGAFAKYVKIKYGIPFIITEHATGFALKQYHKQELDNFKNELRYSSYNIAVSQSLASTLSKDIGGTWIVVPNTIQNIFFEEGTANLKNTKDKNKKIFFTLSNLIPIKGVNLLIPALGELLKQFDNVELWIGGNGSETSRLKKMITNNNLHKNVFLLGNLDREVVIEKLKLVNFYISPSLQETFGIVIIEALAMGLPTIATKCGGPEFIINDEVGIIIKKGLSEELYKAMKFMIQNENKYVPEKIIKYCRENYSEDIVSEKIINIYKKVLND